MKETLALPVQASRDQRIFGLNPGNTGKLWVPTDNTFERLGFEKASRTSRAFLESRLQERTLVNSESPKSPNQVQKRAKYFQVGGREGRESNY